MPRDIIYILREGIDPEELVAKVNAHLAGK